MREMIEMTKAIPAELKATPREGAQKNPKFKKLIDHMVSAVVFG